MDHNPFYDVAKADAHTPQDVAALFVRDASPIWGGLQCPINHIVVGARGTGKTMALRQLDYRTLASGNRTPDFIGVYTHVSRISAIFHALFADRERSADQSLIRQFQQVFADYLALEIVLCAASSGNPQDLLLICSAIFAASGNAEGSADQAFEPVPPPLQHDVIRTWSRDFGNQNAYDASRRLCRSLAQRVKRAPEASRSIGFEYQSDEPDLFTDRALPDDLAEPFRPAFAGGFVRSGEGAHTSLFDLPGSFRLSRGALPELKIPLDTPAIPPLPIDREFIETKSRTSHPYRAAKAAPDPVAYLSRSFIDPADPRWEAVTQALRVAGFSFPKVRLTDKPSAWFQNARRKIAKAHVALFGGEVAPSRAMFEIGLCAGASRRPVDVIVGRLDKGQVPFEETAGLPPKFMRLPSNS